MKKLLLALALAALLLLSLAACGGDSSDASGSESVLDTGSASESLPESGSESTPDPGSESESTSETVTETETDTESETIRELEIAYPGDVPREAVCYATVDGGRRYFASVRDAISFFPSGCTLRLVQDCALDTALPAGYSLAVYSQGFTLESELPVAVEYLFRAHTPGLVWLSGLSLLDDAAYRPFSSLDALTLWVLRETDGQESGRYRIREDGATRTLEKTHGAEQFSVPYTVEWNGRFFYDLPSALADLGRSSGTLTVLSPILEPDPIMTSMPGFATVNIAYGWTAVFCTFDHGATYDDNVHDAFSSHGYNYYNDLSKLARTAGLEGKYIYIWSDLEDFRPGLYAVSAATGEEELWDEDDYQIEADLFLYRFRHVSDIGYADDLAALSAASHFESDRLDLYLVLEAPVADLDAGKYRITDVDPAHYGEKTPDGEGHVIAADVGLFRLERIGGN